MKNSTFRLLFALCLMPAMAEAQYCMLPGRKIYSPDQPGITNFKLNTINRTSGHVEKPLDSPSLVVTTDSTELVRGKTYTVSIMHSKDAQIFPNARNNMRIWIDYDRNFKFTDAGETVLSKDNEAPGGTYTGTFTVPANAPLGVTRLRVTAKMGPDAGHSLPTPCDDPKDLLDYHGEMEDYHVKIVQFPSSVEELQEAMPEVSIYPNPITTNLTISLDEQKNEPLNIAAYDLTGKHIADLVNEQRQTADSYSIDVSTYLRSPGIYFIKITSGNASTYRKIVKAE